MEKYRPSFESIEPPLRPRRKPLRCPATKKSQALLEKDKWKLDFSFNIHSDQQWNEACQRVDQFNQSGLWECVLAHEPRNPQVHLYKRFNEKFIK